MFTSDNALTLIYLLLWLITFCLYHRQNRKFDAGSLIIGLYILYSIMSLITLNNAVYAEKFRTLHLFPFLFLYIMLMTALFPSMYYHKYLIDMEIREPHSRMIVLLSCFIVVFSALQVPYLVNNFKSGIIALFLDSDAGLNAYKEMSLSAVESGKGINNISSIMYNMTCESAVFLFFYFLSIKKHYLLSLFLGLSSFVSLLIPLATGQRGNAVASILTLIACYFLFRNRLSQGVRRIVRFTGVAVVIFVGVLVGLISFSRFNLSQGGVGGSVSWYMGQAPLYFNNYALDDGGIRYGDRTFNLLKRAINPDTPANYVERRLKYGNLHIDDELFTTFAGDFCIDFGPVIALLIFILFNAWVLLQMRPMNGTTIDLHQIYLLYFTICISVQGGMTLYSFSDTSGLKVIFFLAMYYYLKFHQQLLDIFPAYKSTEI